MMTFNVGEDIKILPGVRYQNLSTDYEAWRGQIFTEVFRGVDTTVRVSHGYWLPMVHVRYSPLDWLSLHAAYTNTLNYPDYSILTPRYFGRTRRFSTTISGFAPARSENIDLVLSAHSNEIGLLTIDGFKKRIKDLMFFSRTYRSAKQLAEFPIFRRREARSLNSIRISTTRSRSTCGASRPNGRRTSGTCPSLSTDWS